MASAHVERPHHDSRVAMRPSFFLRIALLACIGIAGAAVFQGVFVRAGGVHAAVAALIGVSVLGVSARVWARDQPVAIAHFADTLTLWNRAGDGRSWRIVGCAQWGAWLLALSLTDGQNRRRTLLIAGDALDSDTFRQLAVNARRAAGAYL